MRKTNYSIASHSHDGDTGKAWAICELKVVNKARQDNSIIQMVKTHKIGDER